MVSQEVIFHEMTVEVTHVARMANAHAAATTASHSDRVSAKYCGGDQYDENIGSHCTASIQNALHFKAIQAPPILLSIACNWRRLGVFHFPKSGDLLTLSLSRKFPSRKAACLHATGQRVNRPRNLNRVTALTGDGKQVFATYWTKSSALALNFPCMW
jgi:hypothetical protein